jgi:hypothetical protein
VCELLPCYGLDTYHASELVRWGLTVYTSPIGSESMQTCIHLLL